MTVLYFPVLQQDELFYSWVARFGQHTAAFGHKALQEELFSDRNSSAVMDFPINLATFVEKISFIRPDLTVDRVIEQTSLWPYFRPFLPEERTEDLIASMRSGHGNDIHTRLGLAAGRVPEAPFVKVCPCCLKQQMSTKSEPYIQRLFQLPSVWVCPEHECHLVFSVLPFRPKNKHAFTPLSEVVDQPFRKTGFESFDIDKLLVLAKDSQQLLQGDYPVHPLAFWRDFYYEMLPEACRKGRASVDQKALHWHVESFWGKALLKKLGAGLEVESDNWLQKMLRKHRSAFHPLLHLLVFRALQKEANLSKLMQVEMIHFKSIERNISSAPEKKATTKAVEADQAEWLTLIEDNPLCSVTELRRKVPSLYARLYRFDRFWLQSHSPKQKRKGNHSEKRVDWRARDFRLARAVLKQIKRFLAKDVNRRVSGTFVLKELKMASVFEKNKLRFKLTQRVLQKYAETVEAYQMRRIDRVVAEMKSRGEKVKEWKIFREARLRDTISTQVKAFVQKKLDKY